MKPEYPIILKAFPLPALLLLPDAPCFTIADVNSAYLKITGKKETDLPGKSIFVTFPDSPEDPDADSDAVVNLRQSHLTALSTGKPHTVDIHEYHEPCVDKLTTRSFENIPVIDNEGKASIIIHSVADNTEKVPEHKKTNESKRFKAALLNIIGQAVVTTDPAGIISSWNKAAEEIYGWTRESEYSRVGRTEDSRENIDLNELVKEIQILFRRQVEEKSAFIRVDKLPMLHSYKAPLRQLCQNLISNAIFRNRYGTGGLKKNCRESRRGNLGGVERGKRKYFYFTLFK